MKIPKLMLGAMLLSLSACVTSPAKDAKHESDLDVMVMAVDEMTKPRLIRGDVQRAEDAAVNRQLLDYTLNLEDAKFLDEQDKLGIRSFVRRATERIKASRRPCGAWARLFNRCQPDLTGL